MAFYDLEEQEQLSALQSWWKQWGAALLIGIALGLATLAAYQGWTWYQRDQSAKASALYAEALKQTRAGEADKARATMATLIERHGSSGYAPLAQLMNARLSFEAEDLGAAKQSLQWVMEHARDEQMKAVARYRLAGLALDEKRYDEALKLLEDRSGETMVNLYADLRGDIYVAKGAMAEARAAYQTALEKTEPRSPLRNLIQIKIDALGQPQ